jgi:hypothetical protein
VARAKRDLQDTKVQGQRDLREVDLVVSKDGGAAQNGHVSELKETATRLVRKARAEQGLPPKIEDPGAIARVVALIQPEIED